MSSLSNSNSPPLQQPTTTDAAMKEDKEHETIFVTPKTTTTPSSSNTTTTAAAGCVPRPLVTTNVYDYPPPTNSLVTPLLTDLYQITMAYAHWKHDIYCHPSTSTTTTNHHPMAMFEIFFRKNPFGGEYTIFCGLDECLKHVANFHFTKSDIDYLQSTPALSHCEQEFFDYLLQLNCRNHPVTLYALPEGTVTFPRIPLLVVEAPIIFGQLLETTLLTLVNYPSLIATNAARMVLAAQQRSQQPSLLPPSLLPLPLQCYQTPICVEFGLRRAQGPDGGFSASKYSAVGGFHATSNVQAGKLLGLQLSGTHAHSFVQSHTSLDDVQHVTIRLVIGNNDNNNKKKKTKVKTTSHTQQHHQQQQQEMDPSGSTPSVTTSHPQEDDQERDDDHDDKEPEQQHVLLLPLVLHYRNLLGGRYLTTNDGELAAFISYAAAFPHAFVCLIDTYDTLHSGLLNFILVSLVLDDLHYTPVGIRLDSGDLAYLSMQCAKTFQQMATTAPIQQQVPNSSGSSSSDAIGGVQQQHRDFFHHLHIVASNDINEAVLHSLNKEGHAITIFGIGTNLVTCQDQPALGCVYKLVQVGGKPRMKLSQDIEKVLIPGRKHPYRLYGKEGYPLLDVMIMGGGGNTGDSGGGGGDTPIDVHPEPGKRIMCRHPFIERKRAAVTPTHVVPLHMKVFEHGQPLIPLVRLDDTREYVRQQLACMRPDILRYVNPTPYKVSVSQNLFTYLHELWQTETPVAELS